MGFAKFKNTNNGKIVILLSTILLFFVLILMILGMYSNSVSNKLSSTNNKTYEIKKENDSTYIINNETDTKYLVLDTVSKSPYFNHIFNQLKVLNYRQNKHFNTFEYFTTLQFTFNVLKSLLIGLTTAIGLYLLKNGWEKSSVVVLRLAFIFAGIYASVETIQITFNVEKNIHSNKEKSVIYHNLETDVLSFVGTGKPNHGEDVSIIEYSNYIDRELIKHYNISFDLDNIPEDSYNIEYLEQNKNN
jgi:hypothetical protein